MPSGMSLQETEELLGSEFQDDNRVSSGVGVEAPIV